MTRISTTSSTHRPSRAFTLTELLIVMGVIAVLSVLTLVSVRAIIDDARLASATNVVTAALDNARALAMKNNRNVLMVFRPRLEGGENVVVDIVACQWTGESYINSPPLELPLVVDRFVPIAGAPVRTLPAGIKVAAPSYAIDQDDVWVTQSHLPATAQLTGEVPGVVFGVMFAPDGTSVTGNAQSDASLIWADFFVDPDPPPPNPMAAPPMMRLGIEGDSPFFLNVAPREFRQRFEDDEPFIVMAPFLAVYDDKEARTLKTGDWNDLSVYKDDLTGPTGYIAENANRLHFNRYTGVVMK